ncbi:MAG: helix-turn-helix domain-containing protein [Bacteroides sp.]|nr:helix-turn-helix domain-containing protein [Bacteroides sp.]
MSDNEMKFIKVPEDFSQSPFSYDSLKIDDISVIESYIQTQDTNGSMFLKEHLILMVLDGTSTLTFGREKYVVHKDEMIFLRKATLVGYHKTGNPDHNDNYDSLMFYLKDEFLRDFVQNANMRIQRMEEKAVTAVKPMNERLRSFAASLKPYFREKEYIDKGLVRLKIMELLYDLASADHNLLQQILQLRQPVRTEIVDVMEQNFMKPVSLSDLAYLSGRSLSSFQRDFMAIYNVAPSVWLREKRLSKAQELLQNTSMSVADVCYSTGFENVSHFSRIYKNRFNYPPSSNRMSV